MSDQRRGTAAFDSVADGGAPRRPPLSWPRSAVLSRDGRRDRRLRDVPRARAARHAQGPDRLRQDPVRRAHGLAPGTAARHRRLPRRSVGERSHRPLSDSRQRHRLARRPAHAGRAAGAICYLDEIIEARADTVVVIHPVTDDRRILPLDKTGELLEAAPGFQLVISYNPGYQHGLKDLKPSTRQRFVALEFGFPRAELEAEIVAHEGARADRGDRARHADQPPAPARGPGLAEVPSTRLIVATARLVAERHRHAVGVPRGPARAADRRSGSARRDARPGELRRCRSRGAVRHVRTRRADPRRRALRDPESRGTSGGAMGRRSPSIGVPLAERARPARVVPHRALSTSDHDRAHGATGAAPAGSRGWRAAAARARSRRWPLPSGTDGRRVYLPPLAAARATSTDGRTHALPLLAVSRRRASSAARRSRRADRRRRDAGLVPACGGGRRRSLDCRARPPGCCRHWPRRAGTRAREGTDGRLDARRIHAVERTCGPSWPPIPWRRPRFGVHDDSPNGHRPGRAPATTGRDARPLSWRAAAVVLGPGRATRRSRSGRPCRAVGDAAPPTPARPRVAEMRRRPRPRDAAEDEDDSQAGHLGDPCRRAAGERRGSVRASAARRSR